MKITRVWAMPNKWTFTIKPIRELVEHYAYRSTKSIDPFAGFNSPADVTNDLNPAAPTHYHLDALEFLRAQPNNSFDLAIYDPPYSYEKARRLYKQKYKDTQTFYNYMRDCKRELCRIVKPGGYAILCGWTSNGLGKKNGFEMLEVLLVPHGWNAHDTIITVEQRTQERLEG